jgi:hypothetical protein
MFVNKITRAMTTKLTLTIDKSVIVSAKKYASIKGKSLSKMVENYLKTMSSSIETELPLSPKVSNLMGSIQLPDSFDYKSALSKSISKKYK